MWYQDEHIPSLHFTLFYHCFRVPPKHLSRPYCLTEKNMSAIHVKPHSLRFLDSNMISFNDNALCWPVNNSLIEFKVACSQNYQVCLPDFFLWGIVYFIQNCNDAFTWSQPLNIPMPHFPCFRRHERGKMPAFAVLHFGEKSNMV